MEGQIQEYDLFVIGGGSGGLACAREAVKHNAKVGLADFVDPSPKGTKWGIGGTCVNVGCIPKKLMHYCATTGEINQDLEQMGWSQAEDRVHKWDAMVKAVQRYIKKMNWGYKVQLKTNQVIYYNKYASFLDPHTIQLDDRKGGIEKIRAKYVLIAVGGRPNYGEFPGAKEFCFSSDDLFSLPKPPGHTLVVGASYIALECAGFLHGLQNPVAIMMRSIPLRGFDQQIANLIKQHMERHGIPFYTECIPVSFAKTEGDKVAVTYKNQQNEINTEVFDNVLLAIGRYAITQGLNLQVAGVQVAENGKILCNEKDQSVSQPHIYAVGDVQYGKPELTPVAIAAGKLVASRLFGGSSTLMDYEKVPTTVFTPIEYSCCGLSEEDAISKFGKERIEVYHAYFKPLEWNLLLQHENDNCYTKIIVDKQENERIIGIHYLGPHGGEVMQGFAAAMKANATYSILKQTVGIHPTAAEEIVKLDITKSSGKNPEKTGC